MLLEGKNAVLYGTGGGIDSGAGVRTFVREGTKVFLAVRRLELVRLLQRPRRQLLGRTAGPRSQLVKRGIGDEVEEISNAPLAYVALVQVPPHGVWDGGEQATLALIESWLGRPWDRAAQPARNGLGVSEGEGPRQAV
jgi:hypothetical protein